MTFLLGVNLLAVEGARTVPVPDPAWGMVAAQAHVPSGWRYAAVATHPSTCALPFYDIKSTAESGDGSIRLVTFPAIQYSYSANSQVNASAAQGGCVIARSPSEFLGRVVAGSIHRGVRVFAVQRVPGSEQRIAQMTQQDQMDVNRHHHSMGSYEQAMDDVVAAQLNYTRAGKPVTSIIVGQFHCVRGVYPVAHVDSTNCLVRQLSEITAPSSQISQVVNGVRGPIVTDSPAWEARVRQAVDRRAARDQQQMNERFAADRASLTNIHNQTMQMINGYAQSSAAIHRQNEAFHESNQRFAQSMGDNQTVTNSQTGEAYDVSSQYGHTYQNTSNGTILQTNSSYSPGDSSLWTVLTPR